MEEVKISDGTLLKEVLKNGKDGMLYRVMAIEQFIDMIVSRSKESSQLPVNRLVWPRMWEDPYEAMLLNKSLNSGCWFGQCWSMIEESDSIWRMATKNKVQRCVKIKVSLDNLKKSLQEWDRQDSFFILDAIQYTDKELINYFAENSDAIKRLIEDNPEFKENGLKTLFSILFMKREPFSSEHEVRLLVCDKTSKDEDKTWTYDFDVNRYVEEIVFDPWTEDYQLELYKLLLDKIGVNDVDKKVRVSRLYKPLKIR